MNIEFIISIQNALEAIKAIDMRELTFEEHATFTKLASELYNIHERHSADIRVLTQDFSILDKLSRDLPVQLNHNQPNRP